MLSRQTMDVLLISVQDGTSVGILRMIICAFHICSQVELGVNKVLQVLRILDTVFQQSGLGCVLVKMQTVVIQNQFLHPYLVLRVALAQRFGMVQHVRVATEQHGKVVYSRSQALVATLRKCTQAVTPVVVMQVVWV